MFLAVGPVGSLLAMLFAASGTPVEGLSIPDCDFGQKYQVRHITCDFVVSNDSDQARTIVLDKPAYPSDSISPASTTVAAHGTAVLTANMDLSVDGGNSSHSFRFNVRGGTKDFVYESVARGFVESVLDTPRAVVDFGVVDLNAHEPPKKKFEVGSDEFPNARLTGIVDKPAYLDISISEDGRSAALMFSPKTPWAFVNEIVRFKTNLAAQPEVALQVQADVHGDVVPDSNPFNMGIIREGDSNEYLIRLTDRSKRPLRVGNLSLDNIHGRVDKVACTPAANDCALVKLTVGKDQPFGHVHGEVVVDLPDYKTQLHLNAWGLYVKKNTEVKNLTEESAKAAAAAGALHAQDGSNGSDLTKALQAAAAGQKEKVVPAAPPPAPPPGHGPLIRWSVANEDLVHGYLIFRADSENGPYARVTNEAIPADRVTGGSSYQWRDNVAVSGRTYWYYIVTVFNDGKKQRLSGAAKVVAK